MILIAPFWQVYVSAKNCLWISLVWMHPGKISVWMMSQCNKKKVCCVWRQRQFFALAFPWLTMKLHDCRPVDNLVKLQTKDDGLPLVFALFVNSSGVYSTKKCSEILHTKNWHYKSLQKSNLIHNLNFYPNSNFQNQNNFSWLHSNKWNSQAIFALT